MSEAQEVEKETGIDIEALQAHVDGTLNIEPDEEIVADDDLVIDPTDNELDKEVKLFDIDAAINSGEHVNLSDKVSQEEAEEAAKTRGWNEDGKDKYGHKISAIEFLERSSFFKKNDLLKGDIDEINKKLSKVLEQNQQIAKKSIDDKAEMRQEFEDEKTKLLSEDFLDGDGIARLKEVDKGIADNQTAEIDNQDDAVELYEKASADFKVDNDWYGTNRAMTALADKVGTEYATNYYEEHGVLPAPEKTFEYVLEEVEKDFPVIEEKPRKPVTRVASGNRVVTQTNKPKKKTLADIPEDQRAVAKEVMEATGQTEEDYLKTYNF